jgi:hypothetical protein
LERVICVNLFMMGWIILLMNLAICLFGRGIDLQDLRRYSWFKWFIPSGWHSSISICWYMFVELLSLFLRNVKRPKFVWLVCSRLGKLGQWALSCFV